MQPERDLDLLFDNGGSDNDWILRRNEFLENFEVDDAIFSK